jgi:hypothetical protein
LFEIEIKKRVAKVVVLAEGYMTKFRRDKISLRHYFAATKFRRDIISPRQNFAGHYFAATKFRRTLFRRQSLQFELLKRKLDKQKELNMD